MSCILKKRVSFKKSTCIMKIEVGKLLFTFFISSEGER